MESATETRRSEHVAATEPSEPPRTRPRPPRRTYLGDLSDRRFYALLVWSLIMAMLVMGTVLQLAHG